MGLAGALRRKHFYLYGAVERPKLTSATFNVQTSGTIDYPPTSRYTSLLRRALCVIGLLLPLIALTVVVSRRTDQSTKGLKAGNSYNSKLKGQVSRVSSSTSSSSYPGMA